MALLSPLGGWISDLVSRRIGRRYGRIATVWMGMGIAGLLLFAGSHVKITALALPMIALAAGFTMFAAASFWAVCIDLAPGFSASLSALMNTFGSIGGAVSSTVTASIVVHQGWNKALDTAAWITVVSALWFSAVNAERVIDERPN
jgi:MFS transporter, ACS family, glucarate transporter